jgi:tetratricopeptide (TPR) repeat protein
MDNDNLTQKSLADRLLTVRGLLLLLLAITILFVATYALAWFNAYNLARGYLADADAAFENGEYVNALTGYEAFDEDAGARVFHGGYSQVVNIWRHRDARPVPSEVETARARINDIINTHMTIDEAERYIQRSIGDVNPYTGIIFVRLGELYEAEGDLDDARDIYEEALELFPRDLQALARAQANLTRLDALEAEAESTEPDAESTAEAEDEGEGE